jgi:crotonobetainyl-CoA:carnitine CoA-transferase CaiB-like acyl-CoA transferase
LVSSSLFEFALTSLGTVVAGYLASGALPGLLGTHSPTFAPYGGFRTADGWLVVAGAGSEQMWARACTVLGLDSLVDDERFSDNNRRVRHRDELTACIEGVLRRETSAHWLAKLEAAGVPAAQVEELSEVLDRPQVGALGALQTLEHAQAGSYRVVGPPLRLAHRALGYARPAPVLGQDTRDLLMELDYSSAEVNHLVDTGVVVLS